MPRTSYDSGQRPLSQGPYTDGNSPSPYGSGDPYYNESSGFYPPQKKPSGSSNWIKIGIPVLVIVIAGAVVGGVLGSRAKSENAGTSGNSNGGASVGAGPSNPSDVVGIKTSMGRFATGTDVFLMPVYPSTTNTAAFTKPTFVDSSNAAIEWPADPFTPQTPSLTNLRPDRPRLLAPQYKWAALPQLMTTDPYLKGWHDRIMGNATAYAEQPPLAYNIDGGLDKSGVLDIARETKMRIKAFSYAYRMTNQTSWIDRTWRELQNGAGNGTQPFGTAPDRWNTAHFLDLAEFTGAFAIAYDWLHDVWTDEQREQIMWSILNLGLNYGLQAHDGTASYNWWRTVNGNWNCVCNGGMVLGSLAILGDDPTDISSRVLAASVENAAGNCVRGPSTDGTWSETANYWYFGTSAHAEMTSALVTATGGDHGLLNSNPNFSKTGLFHIYVTGMTSMFDYGDHGPNKFSTTANGVLYYGAAYAEPRYTLYQRDRFDAAEPYSMFYYDPSVTGAWWEDLALDHYFDDPNNQWASMRSSWTDNSGLFAAIKAGEALEHQTHGNLDAGTFVIDAMGERWAGELGSGDYLAQDYFSNELQTSTRWLYYRCMSEGQNVITLGGANQIVDMQPTVRFESSGTAQGSSTVFSVPNDSTAYFVTDLTTAYGGTSIHRGMRLLNGRRQILLQDEINGATGTVRWRMHTNATITIGSGGTTADLAIGQKRLQVQLLNAPAGAAFERVDPVRTEDAPALAAGTADQENPGVSVLQITLPAGSYNLEVLFNPQWSGMSADQFVTPGSVALNDWSLTSHN